jgi:prephenate dehydratase
MIRIGYQGVSGSNSEIAAMKMAESNAFADVTYVPLVSSKGVIDALEKGQVDYGVVATKNSIGGEVLESMVALKNKHLELVSTIVMPIHHCLFKKSADIDDRSIKYVASHIQALRQTRSWVAKNLPDIIDSVEIEDTAIGAVKLKEGELGADTAVICSMKAGKDNGLELVATNIEDDKRNRTEFRLLKLPATEYVEKESLSGGMIDEKSVVDKLIQAILILAIIGSFFIMSHFEMTPFETATTISGYVVMLGLIVIKVHKKLINKTFIGYWKYYTIPLESKDDIQHYHVPRIVEIKEVDGKLQLAGYTSSTSQNHISFTSDKVYVNNTDSNHGHFLYEYSSDARALDLGGYVLLKWYKKYSYATVKRMSGQYFGVKSKEIGTLVYQRISQEEFNNIRNSDFLRNADQ